MIQVQDVTVVDVNFGGDIKKLLPAYNDIPAEFKRYSGTKWNNVVTDWFFCGLKNCVWTPKPGIDTKKALAHIAAVMASFDLKHEHKEAGCAYLMSEFFEDVTYDKAS